MGEEVCSWDGTISAREFYASAHLFEERWKRSNPNLPPWKWVSSTTQNLGGRVLHPHNQFNGFLTLEKLCLFELTRRETPFLESLNEVKAQETSLFEEDEPIDNATLVSVSNPGVGIHYYDFHILYSAPFRVPVLFFRAYQTDGQTLTLDEIEKQLPSSSSKILMESKWTFITQEEHPELKRPWYKLHPCGTSEWMKLLFKSDSSLSNHKSEPIQELYLFSWLSVVGQVVGLRIPIEIMNHHLEIINHQD